MHSLGFEVTGETPDDQSLWQTHQSVYIELGPALGPVLEVKVNSIEEAKLELMKQGCKLVKDEPEIPRCYVKIHSD